MNRLDARGLHIDIAGLRRRLLDNRRRLAFAAVVVLFAAIPASAGLSRTGTAPGHRSTKPHAPLNTAAQLATQQPVQLSPATSIPAPAPPALAAGRPLQPHELFGFAPYWTLDQAGSFDLRALTTVAYFGVDANPDGTVQRTGAGWDGYSSEQLVSLISAAHAQSDRVVLTVKNFDAAQLHQLATNPASAGRLAGEVAELIRAKNMDGANLDFEGTGGTDREGIAAFLSEVARQLHAQDSHWQVSVDTYANSAGSTSGWFDIPAIAPAVDALFVMAYDMYQDGNASPNAPLSGYSPSDEEAMRSYTAVVAPGKVMLGVPFYGYDWATPDNHPNDPAAAPPTPITYAKVAQAGHPTYWDPRGSSPWTAYQDGGQWHEAYYDDPTSLALKARLANNYHLLGLGIWALGMDGNSPAMMDALLGGSRPVKAELAAPNGASNTAAPAPGKSPGSASSPAPAPAPKPGSHPSPSPSPTPSAGPGPPSPPPLPLPSPPLP